MTFQLSAWNSKYCPFPFKRSFVLAIRLIARLPANARNRRRPRPARAKRPLRRRFSSSLCLAFSFNTAYCVVRIRILALRAITDSPLVTRTALCCSCVSMSVSHVNTSVDEILLPKGLYPFYASTSKATVPHGVAAFVCENEKCVRSFVPPILSHLKAHVWPSSNHQMTFPGTRVPFRDEYFFSPPHFCSVTGST